MVPHRGRLRWSRDRVGRDFAAGEADATRQTLAVTGDRGSSAVELAILAPAVLLILWLSVQFAFWYQGRQVALAAAQAGDRVARQEAGVTAAWQQDAVQRAISYYSALGTKVLGGNITATTTGSGANEVGVTVTGRVVSIVFGLTLTIHETAAGPVECFRPDLNGGQQCAG